MPKLKKTASKKSKRHRMHEEMEKFREGKLHSGSEKGPVVTNPKQAIAIGLSESGQSKKKSPKAKKEQKEYKKEKKLYKKADKAYATMKKSEKSKKK